PASPPPPLQEKIDQAPQFFMNSPVLINLDKLENPSLLNDCSELLQICRDLGLQPLGFTAVPEALEEAVQTTGLATLPRPGERALKMPESEPSPRSEEHTSELQ